MKNIKFSILLFFIFLITFSAKASDTASVKFFPLNVGDYYSYLYYVHSRYHPPESYLSRAFVTKDTLISDVKYYFVTGLRDSYSNCWMRTDTITGSLYKYDSANSCSFYDHEILLDSFSIAKNDTVQNCSLPFKCTDTSNTNVFNQFNVKRKVFYYSSGYPNGWTYNKTFAKEFGLIYYQRFSGDITFSYTLKGCQINGIIYGDTTSVGVDNESSFITKNFTLFQNYPNPFNPETIINYKLGIRSFVSLKVYNALGLEVETLVNGNKPAGSYEIEFDGSDLSSGLYFYSLSVDGNIIDTKSMVLLK